MGPISEGSISASEPSSNSFQAVVGSDFSPQNNERDEYLSRGNLAYDREADGVVFEADLVNTRLKKHNSVDIVFEGLMPPPPLEGKDLKNSAF